MFAAAPAMAFARSEAMRWRLRKIGFSVPHPVQLLLPGIRDLHDFHFLAAVVSPVHVKRLGILVDNLPYRPMRHLSAARLIMLSLQCNRLAIGACRTFHQKYPCAHGIDPGCDVFFPNIVVSVDSNSGEGLAHHLAGEFLLEKTPV